MVDGEESYRHQTERTKGWSNPERRRVERVDAGDGLKKTCRARVFGAYDGNDALSNSAQSTRRVLHKGHVIDASRVMHAPRATPPAGLVRTCEPAPHHSFGPALFLTPKMYSAVSCAARSITGDQASHLVSHSTLHPRSVSRSRQMPQLAKI